ncbi:MAG: aminofutalosine synthase MqnE [Acidobacteria bacterium]|nr:MAG: aminofutalosine synthase MqnE [Acidobacteriota bacterium]REK02754.1 MAG: aminofutalosine synthase MqnE [Acidobacteriota bacterium]REK13441.1 MAG: aminofutalosine synthase MqnE [Acidobacteriota bacterium]REK41435.1 MAG: aminofutalosine synthase MqnE [Acidobacteriota bacterium]
MNFFIDEKLGEIANKIKTGDRLTFEEGLALYETEDLHGLGRLADSVRRERHGKATFYNVNRHFNHTNICVADCKFCGFYRRGRDEDAYTHSVEDAVRLAGEAVAEGATELHIVGGLNTKLPFEYYTDLFSSLKKAYPDLHLKALTMVELDFFARFYKMSDEDVIEKLAEAGMDSCPGGGAEIFSEPTRSRICDHKCDGDRWLELAGKVHKAGLKTNATMLYGHIESIEDRVDHLVQLRNQQDRTGGFQCFIPLAFYPPGTALSNLPGPDGIDSLRTIAVSRLMLDNFDHIKAYWVMLGKNLAQAALHFGANDLDGTITDGGELTESYSVEFGEVKMSKDELIALIENAGFEAVERDTVYNRVERAAV